MVRFRARFESPTILFSLHEQRPNFAQTLKMAATTEVKSQRPVCSSCSKPIRVCLCNRIQNPGLDNSINVTIFQHSLERNHPLNSARIAKLGLKNVTLAIVSDVNFDARFAVRLMEPGLKSQRMVSEEGDGYELGREDLIGFKRFKKCPEKKICSLIDSNGELELSNDVNGFLQNGENHFLKSGSISNKEPALTIEIGKYGVITDLTHVWLPESDCQKTKPDFEQLLGSQEALDALAKGFVVKKMQKRQLSKHVRLQEHEEFELEVSPGSVLLFPSEKAVGIDDIDFEVKNLIVLDGTWAKAKRMYNENPWLKLLPHLKLDLDKTSLYAEVREQPKAGYLSTIESIVYALKGLGENSKELNNLLDVFESMVGDQRRCKDERLSKISQL